MANIELSQKGQEPINNFPKSLADLKLPTLKETEALVREGEDMIKQATDARKGKLMRSDAEMSTIVVYSGSSRSINSVPAPVIK